MSIVSDRLDRLYESAKNLFILLIFIVLMGIIFWLSWAAIKIPLWLSSPFKGGSDTTEEDIMKISFNRMMWTPYSIWIIFWSGFVSLWVLVVGLAWNDTSSVIWEEDNAVLRVLLFSMIVVGVIKTIYYMVLELFMIFSFREWFYWMREKGLNPLG